jgi:Uma2 family endonuclease
MATALSTQSASRLITADEFARLPDLGHVELVRGAIVEMNPPAFRHGVVCGNVFFAWSSFIRSRQLGRVVCNDTGVVTERNPDTVRGADVAYFSFERVPASETPAGYADASPDVVAEVKSPSDSWGRLLAKAAEYLAAGVRAVCVFDPDTSTVRVYRENMPEAVFEPDAEFTLPELHPDFRVAVREFYI